MANIGRVICHAAGPDYIKGTESRGEQILISLAIKVCMSVNFHRGLSLVTGPSLIYLT